MKRRIVAFGAVVLLVVSFLAVSNATAGGAPERFRFHVANAFIQTGTGLPQTGARAQADNNDFVSVSGKGKFNPATGQASGGGAFAHTDVNGTLVGYGAWTARGVADFEFFGCGGEGLPPNFCGGTLTLDVRIRGTDVTEGAASVEGILVITCLIGPDIPAGAEEGITLDIPGLINFDDLVPEEGGLTLFVDRDA